MHSDADSTLGRANASSSGRVGYEGADSGYDIAGSGVVDGGDAIVGKGGAGAWVAKYGRYVVGLVGDRESGAKVRGGERHRASC